MVGLEQQKTSFFLWKKLLLRTNNLVNSVINDYFSTALQHRR